MSIERAKQLIHEARNPKRVLPVRDAQGRMPERSIKDNPEQRAEGARYLAAALKVIEEVKLEHMHTATYVNPGSETVWDYDGPCICGDEECSTLAALDAFEALP